MSDKASTCERVDYYKPDCRYFSGYKPCKFKRTCEGCEEYAPKGVKVLLINLDAMGDVVRTTALLNPIRRKYGDCFITWVTLKNAAPILENNPLVDEVLVYGFDAMLALEPRSFDVVMNVDKSARSAALAMRTMASSHLGFGLDEDGSIIPLNQGADYQYRTGLDDDLKFFKNEKNEQEQLAETMEVAYARDPYVFEFTVEEKEQRKNAADALGLDGGSVVVGLNTGCSELYPYKKLPVEYQAELIDRIAEDHPDVRIALMGGPEDLERNPRIGAIANTDVVETPCTGGLRSGFVHMDLADVVITGDSLGMHMAIALGKRVVAWFGLTCEQEIDLFDRGVSVVADVDCRPCWRRSCEREDKCYERVDMDSLLKGVGEMISLARTEKADG